ncbi:hypothetical protein [Hydromonas duriensis]|uniref:VCBS repeat protein n=1 Tax=Hydromonas duriensis TaxID=1527608 RepID=A0A4R6Y7G7_9BURK|nr:hypothetical protein [Hydromonas duriensis]TDR31268.1 hypothetical protein DFR44_11131 [Hydromonas duriensis]
MKKTLYFALLSTVFYNAVAAASGVQDLVPTGWNIVQKAEGDLNNDGLNDVAIIVENTDPANFKANDANQPRLNLNPRHLIIALQNKDQSYVTQSTQKQLIPSANNAQTPCLTDPLADAEPMSIKDGTLRLNLKYKLNCGSNYVSNNHYVFRYNGSNVDLIGYDSSSELHATGASNEKNAQLSVANTSFFSSDSSTLNPKLLEEQKNAIKNIWQQLNNIQMFTLDMLP